MMMRDGTVRTIGVLKVCVATTGSVSSINVVEPRPGTPSTTRGSSPRCESWRYRPYLVDGRPAPVCGMVTFVYAIK